MPAFRAAVETYWSAMESLTARLNRLFALALDLPKDFFVQRSDRHATSMRINYYPVQHSAPLPGQLRAGAHSDYGAFTILRAETTPGGLQALHRDGSWIDVPKIPDGFVINIGDLLMRWTNDKFVSTVHRVINPPEAVRESTDRMSIAYFFLPNHDADVTPLASCVTSDTPARHEPTTAGAYWRGKIVAARQISAYTA
jgi:isopenicillin N synthase-like dioxygenase